MGLVSSIHEPMVDYDNSYYRKTSKWASILLDEIVYEFAALIADIEDGKVPPLYLKKEIEKKVDQQKGLFNAEQIKKEIFDTIYGYGLLQRFIVDPEVSDIDIPRYDFILIKRFGIFEQIEVTFSSEESFEQFCRLLIIRHGGVINAMDAHCRVSDKSNRLRINVSIPPRNATGTSLNIRKHKREAYKYDTLQQIGFLDERSRKIIEAANRDGKNILICGKGASGKTTLLRTLIENGDKFERMLICESDTELYPQKKNSIVQHIEKRRKKHGSGSLEALIKEGLTMSLDTYCIGEITGSEAWPFVKAGYTDHRILGTLHAQSSFDALERLLMLIENETRMEESALKTILANSMEIIIYLKNFSVYEITLVKAYDKTNKSFEYEMLYERRSIHVLGNDNQCFGNSVLSQERSKNQKDIASC